MLDCAEGVRKERSEALEKEGVRIGIFIDYFSITLSYTITLYSIDCTMGPYCYITPTIPYVAMHQ